MRREETSDPEASWPRKNQGSAPGGKQWVFCCKTHTLCDAATKLPLAVALTAGSRGDSPMLPLLLEQAQADYDWFRPAVCGGDRGYDASANYARLLEMDVASVLRNGELSRGRLHCGLYTGDGVPTYTDKAGGPVTGLRPWYGVPTYTDKAPLEYVRADAERVAMFISCPMTVCLLAAIVCGARRRAASRAVGW